MMMRRRIITLTATIHGLPAQAEMTADHLPRSETEGSPRETEQRGITPRCVIHGTWDRSLGLFQSPSSQTSGASIPTCGALPSVPSITPWDISVPYISQGGQGDKARVACPDPYAHPPPSHALPPPGFSPPISSPTVSFLPSSLGTLPSCQGSAQTPLRPRTASDSSPSGELTREGRKRVNSCLRKPDPGM